MCIKFKIDGAQNYLRMCKCIEFVIQVLKQKNARVSFPVGMVTASEDLPQRHGNGGSQAAITGRQPGYHKDFPQKDCNFELGDRNRCPRLPAGADTQTL